MAGLERAVPRHEPSTLRPLIRQDQLSAIRRNVLAGVPVNSLIGAIALFVAIHHQNGLLGGAWFVASSLVNMVRVGQCWRLGPVLAAQALRDKPRAVRRELDLFCFTALISGLVWALIPFLCNGYTDPQALFYLTVICGITAGAITHGTPYARMPVFFHSAALALSIFVSAARGRVRP